jgi:hypothetical protein
MTFAIWITIGVVVTTINSTRNIKKIKEKLEEIASVSNTINQPMMPYLTLGAALAFGILCWPVSIYRRIVAWYTGNSD